MDGEGTETSVSLSEKDFEERMKSFSEIVLECQSTGKSTLKFTNDKRKRFFATARMSGYVVSACHCLEILLVPFMPILVSLVFLKEIVIETVALSMIVCYAMITYFVVDKILDRVFKSAILCVERFFKCGLFPEIHRTTSDIDMIYISHLPEKSTKSDLEKRIEEDLKNFLTLINNWIGEREVEVYMDLRKRDHLFSCELLIRFKSYFFLCLLVPSVIFGNGLTWLSVGTRECVFGVLLSVFVLALSFVVQSAVLVPSFLLYKRQK